MGNSKMLPKFRLTLYLKRFMLTFLYLVTGIVQKLNRRQIENRIPFQYVVPCQPINNYYPPIPFCKSRAEVRSSISFFISFNCPSK